MRAETPSSFPSPSPIPLVRAGLRWLLALGLALFGWALAVSGTEAGPLFDGKSFAGWEGETNQTWRIVDGAFVGGSLSGPVPRNEFLCTTRAYTNFVLRLKFKLLGEGANAGVQFRTRRIPNDHEVSGYQADLGDPEWWGCLYDESRRNRVLAKADAAAVRRVLKPGDWNEYTVRCEGPRIQLWINGLPTVDYIETDAGIEGSGLIGLQIHGGPPSEAWYKDIRLEELP